MDRRHKRHYIGDSDIYRHDLGYVRLRRRLKSSLESTTPCPECGQCRMHFREERESHAYLICPYWASSGTLDRFDGVSSELEFPLQIQNSTKGLRAPANSMLNVETQSMKLSCYMKIQRQPVAYQKYSNGLSHMRSYDGIRTPYEN